MRPGREHKLARKRRNQKEIGNDLVLDFTRSSMVSTLPRSHRAKAISIDLILILFFYVYFSAISTLIGMGINIAIAYGAYTVIGGFNTISFTDDEGSTTEAITDLASRLTEPTTELEEDNFTSADEYFYMSQSSLIKAAVLAGVLSTVPALVIAFIAYTTQRELDQLRHECEYDCDDVV